ncbi:MAG TPA: hypothetical protein VK914_03345 [bacterium]|nr:hypothetical protein [bacterium]
MSTEKWLDEFAVAVQGPDLDLDSNRLFKNAVPTLGRLLFELTKLGVLEKEIPDVYDGIPFGVFGGFSLQRLDLGSLLRAWKLGGFRDGCPKCKSEKSVLVFFVGGSPLSGACGWTGVCQQCGGLHSFPNTISHIVQRCAYCKEKHTSTAWPEGLTFGGWCGKLSDYRKLVGNFMSSKNHPTNQRFVRSVPEKPQGSRYGFEQADMTTSRTLKAFGLRREGNTIVSDDAEAVVLGEFNDEEMKAIEKREELARKRRDKRNRR